MSLQLQRIARSVAKHTLILFGAAAAGVLIAAVTEAGAADRIPDPRPVPTAPRYGLCELPYTLAPGERAVLMCITAWDPRRPTQGIVTIQSNHEAIDATLVKRFPLHRVVVALTNRSIDVVEASATIEIH